MRYRLRSRAASALVLALMIAACSSGDGTDSTPASEPVATLDTVGESDDIAPPETEPVTSDTVAVPTDSNPSSSTTTTVLTPSPDADLPTEAPSDVTTAPVTTVAGPLPAPSVQLFELATYDRPVGMAADDRDSRLFFVEQGGRIVASDDESDSVIFDISDVGATSFSGSSGERGLLGLAFHPEENVAYVNFTNANGNTVIAEFVFDPVTYVFDPASFREVLTVEQPFSNHNGGGLAFGPDGYLYIGLGDGGSGGDPNRAGLDLSTRLGKMLRIDPLATPNGAFSVPDDNPFVGVDGADPAIWATGLRNPWRFSFDSLTGDLWIADVGQNAVEEINLAPATDGRDAAKGVSFGWSAFEGDDRYNADQPADGHLPPTVAYGHEEGDCSVSGGVVARNSSFVDLNGWYVYGDYCSGRVWALDTTSVAAGPSGPVGTPRIVQVATVPALVEIAEGPFGDIYAISNNGPTYRLAPA